ncbi:MAG: prepilin peptidase [Patescibacteria group bacterium]
MEIFLIVVIGALGLAVGSFLNAAVYRLHIGKPQSLLTDRSICPNCKKKLAVRDLIPLVSFLVLRGKCRFCKKPIDPIYFWTELATGLAFLAVALFGACGTIPLLLNLLFVSILIFLGSYDARFGEIPDSIAIFGIVFALIFAPHFWPAVLGALVGGGFFTALVLISNGKWMGGGDIRLGLLLGALGGWRGFAVALFVASFTGSLFGLTQIFKKKKKLKSAIPFAPFLAVGGIVAILFTEKIWSWYLGFLLA